MTSPALTRVQVRTKRVLEQFEVHGTLTSFTLSKSLGLAGPEDKLEGRKLRHAIGDVALLGFIARTEHKSKAHGRSLPLFAITSDGRDELVYLEALSKGKIASRQGTEPEQETEAQLALKYDGEGEDRGPGELLLGWDDSAKQFRPANPKIITEAKEAIKGQLGALVQEASQLYNELKERVEAGEVLVYTDVVQKDRSTFTEAQQLEELTAPVKPGTPSYLNPPVKLNTATPVLPQAKPLTAVTTDAFDDNPESKIVPLRPPAAPKPVAVTPPYPVIGNVGDKPQISTRDLLLVLYERAKQEGDVDASKLIKIVGLMHNQVEELTAKLDSMTAIALGFAEQIGKAAAPKTKGEAKAA